MVVIGKICISYYYGVKTMKAAGFIGKIDNLGRIIIPKPIRVKYELKPNDCLEIFTDPDSIILKKYKITCTFCGEEENLVEFKGKAICQKCLEELNK